MDGAGHDAQFSDAKVLDPTIVAVRAKVTAEIEQSMTEDSVHVAITMTDGTTVETYVEHATGSPENPMSDEALQAKYSALAGEIIGIRQANDLQAAVWDLDYANDVGQVAKLFVTK